MVEIKPQRQLVKFKISRKLQKEAHKLLGHHLKEADGIPEITGKVYAMCKRTISK